jgi:hypothetical protein
VVVKAENGPDCDIGVTLAVARVTVGVTLVTMK